mmetsp:Transcript_16979/g.25924  ORF Transcript_16979/g.25924 Transcript_16979/m.25924 type:complete len:144 (-) Transcript_16979:306-737(-)
MSVGVLSLTKWENLDFLTTRNGIEPFLVETIKEIREMQHLLHLPTEAIFSHDDETTVKQVDEEHLPCSSHSCDLQSHGNYLCIAKPKWFCDTKNVSIQDTLFLLPHNTYPCLFLGSRGPRMFGTCRPFSGLSIKQPEDTPHMQ